MKRRRLCPHCGKEVSKNAAFCPYCGFDLSKTVCENCMKKVDLKADVCPYCGTPLRKEVILPYEIDHFEDERYRILEKREGYVILKEQDITLEKHRPNNLEDFFYLGSGLYYDAIYIENRKYPVLYATYPIITLEEYWEILPEQEKTRTIFKIANLVLKYQNLYYASDFIYFDANNRLIVSVREEREEGFVSAFEWFKGVLGKLYKIIDGKFKDFIESTLNNVESLVDLVKELFKFFTNYVPVEFESFAITSQGLVRSNNEDNYLTISCKKRYYDGIAPHLFNTALYVISDGMGGHRGGEEASKLVVKIIGEEIIGCLSKQKELINFASVIRRAIGRANEVVYQKNRLATIEREKMGATVAGAFVVNTELWYFNVGDSSIMLVDKKGLVKLSIDDVLYNNKKALTQAVGIAPSERLNPHIAKYEIEEDLKLVLCSDGLTDLVKFSEIEEIVQKYNPSEAATYLLDLALKRGGIDNITIVVVALKRNKLY